MGLKKYLTYLTVVWVSIASLSSANASIIEIFNQESLEQIQTGLDRDYKITQSFDVAPENTDLTYITGSFSGTLNGMGFTIGGLNVPLFDTIGGDSRTIIENLNIEASGDGINGNGILANQVGLNSEIINVTGTGNVSGTGLVGGLVGNSNGNFTNSHFEGSVTTESDNTDGDFTAVGGLIGSSSGTVTNSSSTGEVNGDFGDSFGTYAGGLIGHSQGSVLDSYSNSDVNGYGNTGGLIGYTNSTVDNSYATGIVINSSNPAIDDIKTGGLIGKSTSNVIDSYSIGNVTGPAQKLGGLVGMTTGQVTNSYATGDVVGLGSGWDVGGLIGYTDSLISNSYSTGSVSGWRYVGGLVGISSANIENSYSNILGSVIADDGSVGGLVGQFEGLAINTFANISGDISGTYSVGGLVGNLDSGEIRNSYSHIGGTLIGEDQVGGLVGSVNSGGIINSFAQVNGDINGSGDGIGGLVGNNYGLISNSYAKILGSISSLGDNLGGLVGRNDDLVENSQAQIGGGIIGNERVGGLIGFGNINSVIENSYGLIGLNLEATSLLGGRVGGIAGYTEGDIENSTVSISGSIIGTWFVGGIAGYSQGGILNSDVSIMNNISGLYDTGGLAGRFDSGEIYNSDVLIVNSSILDGLLAGYSYSGNIIDSYVSYQGTINPIEDGSPDFFGDTGGGASSSFPSPDSNIFDITTIPNFPSILQVVNSGTDSTQFAVSNCLNSGKPYIISLLSSHVNSCTSENSFEIFNLILPLQSVKLKNVIGFEQQSFLKLLNFISVAKLNNSEETVLQYKSDILGNKALYISTKDTIQLSAFHSPNKKVQLWVKSKDSNEQYFGELSFTPDGEAVLPALKFNETGVFELIFLDSGKSEFNQFLPENRIGTISIYVN